MATNNLQQQDVFVDAESTPQGVNQALSYKQIVLTQVSRITLKAATEFHGGYVKETTRSVNGLAVTDKTYVPDSRDEYIQSIDCLYDLLIAYFDETIQKEIADFETNTKILKADLHKQVAEKRISSDNYKNQIASNHRILFRSLTMLLKRLGYLEATRGED